MWPFRKKRKPIPVCHAVSPLMRLTDRDHVSRHQAFQGILAMGSTGSGKTSTLAYLMLGMFRTGFGMLFLPAKGTDVHSIVQLARLAGREHELRIFRPNSGFVFDFLSYELNSPGGVEAAAALMGDLSDIASKTGKESSRDPFWPKASQRQIRMSLMACLAAYGKCDIGDLFKFIQDLPNSLEQKNSPEWNDGFVARTFEAAKKMPGWEANLDLNLAADYALSEFPRLSDRTSSSITAMSMNLLSNFIHYPIRDLILGESNLSPDDVLNGRIVIIDTPPLVHKEAGRFTQLVWKLSFLRSVLAREVTETTRPVCLWQDEFQVHCVPDIDSAAQAVARSQKLSVVAATQNFPLLQQALGSKEDAEALIANFQTKLLFSNSCPVSNSFFSEMLGSSKHLFINGSVPTSDYCWVSDMLGVPNRDSRGNSGFSETWHPDVPPDVFTKLKKGGPEDGFIVDLITFQGGRTFSNGKTWIRTSIPQMV
jgi:TraM recognition site of TraD and TraG